MRERPEVTEQERRQQDVLGQGDQAVWRNRGLRAPGVTDPFPCYRGGLRSGVGTPGPGARPVFSEHSGISKPAPPSCKLDTCSPLLAASALLHRADEAPSAHPAGKEQRRGHGGPGARGGASSLVGGAAILPAPPQARASSPPRGRDPSEVRQSVSF